MTVATFDARKFANTLKAAGVSDKQAEAQATAFAELVDVNFKELATKADLDRLATDLKRAIAELRIEPKHEIQASQAKHEVDDLLLVKWMFGATFTGVVAVLGLLARLLFVQGR